MFHYILRRLLLLPITLFFIVIVNFIIINLAPGDPVTVTEITPEGGATRQQGREVAFGRDDRYLQFREFYGLTLPILFNRWPYLSESYVTKTLWQLVNRKVSPQDHEEMSVKEYDHIRIDLGDQARFIMPHLLQVITDPGVDKKTKEMAIRFFVRGGTWQAILGPGLSLAEQTYNQKISSNNKSLDSILTSDVRLQEQAEQIKSWYENNKLFYHFEPTTEEKIAIFFLDTRFSRYMSRVLSFNFGTLRNDSNKTVLNEVTKRFKYSLTLAFFPMIITFFLCQVIGYTMAYWQNRWPDIILNLICLVLYAVPVFVVAPFLIENVALNGIFPFTNIPIPTSGFTNPESIYHQETSFQRLFDILEHIALPIVAIAYGSLAAQSRLSRTAILEVLNQDYIRTAWAKGVPPFTIMFKHVGRNAAITVVTSLAGSLGIVLGGSLVVETLFDINGFGKFFYDAIVNRDYNVIMFSTLAGSFLTLAGYLFADIAYTMLDPRITLD